MVDLFPIFTYPYMYRKATAQWVRKKMKTCQHWSMMLPLMLLLLMLLPLPLLLANKLRNQIFGIIKNFLYVVIIYLEDYDIEL